MKLKITEFFFLKQFIILLCLISLIAILSQTRKYVLATHSETFISVISDNNLLKQTKQTIQLSNNANSVPTGLNFINQEGGLVRAIYIEGTTAYIGAGPRVIIVDISDPINLVPIGRSPILSNIVKDIFVSDGFAYVIVNDHTDDYDEQQGQGLHIIDISDPTNPVLKGTHHALGEAYRVIVSGSLAFIAALQHRMTILDVSDPDNPTILSTGFDFPSGIYSDIAVVGQYIYALNKYSEGLFVLDVSDPKQPQHIATLSVNGDSFTVDGNFLYVPSETDFHVFDISTPQLPVEIGTEFINIRAHDIEVINNYAYLAASTEVVIVDVTDPENPVYVDSILTMTDSIDRIAAFNQFLFTAGDWWKSSVQFPIYDASNPEQPVVINTYENMMQAKELDIRNDFVFVLNPKSLSVYDNPSPHQIEFLDIYIAEGLTHLTLSDQYAIVASNIYKQNEIQLIDISDPSSLELISTYPVTDSITTLSIAENYVYFTDEMNLHVLSIENPDDPVEVYNDKIFSDSYTINDIAIYNNYAYVLFKPNSLVLTSTRVTIIDISDPANPILGNHFSTGLPYYFNGTAIDANDQHLVVGHWTYPPEGRIVLVDISNKDEPTVISQFSVRSLDIEIIDDYILVGNENGIQIINIVDPFSPFFSYTMPLALNPAMAVTLYNNYIYSAFDFAGLYIWESLYPTSFLPLIKQQP